VRLVIAVVERRAATAAMERLRAAGYGATRLASSGGFLRRGNTTLFTGVEDDQVDAVLELLRTAAAEGARGQDPARGEGNAVAFVTRVEELRRV
jgi:uncharacterized protein YaaQ